MVQEQGSGSKHPAVTVLGGVGVPHPATCIARAYVCVGCGGVW